MPYLKLEQRERAVKCPVTSGELNYAVTVLVRDYLNRVGLNYQSCNDIVGALDNAKDEFRRRIQHPYEEKKIKENTDVY